MSGFGTDHEGDNIYAIATDALRTAHEEVRQWRIRAEDAEINLKEADERWEHQCRMLSIFRQIDDERQLAIAAYKNMVEDLQGAGMVGRQSEEILALQEKLKFALSFIPRGDSETFAFPDGDEADYGSQAEYSELQLDYFCQALPLALSCLNRIRAHGVRDETVHEILEASTHAIERIHERTQVGDEVCQFTGQMREKDQHWLQEEEDDGQN